MHPFSCLCTGLLSNLRYTRVTVGLIRPHAKANAIRHAVAEPVRSLDLRASHRGNWSSNILRERGLAELVFIQKQEQCGRLLELVPQG